MIKEKIEENNIKSGIVWNLVSYIFLGISTIISYVLITRLFGKAALGAYNIILSIYMICGHIGVMGLQSAAIYYVPQLERREEKGQYYASFLSVTLFFGFIISGIIFLSADIVGGMIFGSDYVIEGLKKIPLAIVLFSVNKMLAGFINAMGEMRKFAVLQSLRYFIIVGYICTIIFRQLDFISIFNSFVISEFVVWSVGNYFLFCEIDFQRPKWKYIKESIRFGIKAMLGNVISDVNTRVDVMMLGILCEDAIVGKYSFVTIIAEGIFSILFVFRNNYNPLFSTLLYRNNLAEIHSLCKKLKRELRVVFGGIAIAIIVLYTLFCMGLLDKGYRISIIPVIIILFGSTLMAPYFVMGNLCTLAGKPINDTYITLCSVVVNIVLNYFLIIQMQLVGAAIATCISYIIYAFLMAKMIERNV